MTSGQIDKRFGERAATPPVVGVREALLNQAELTRSRTSSTPTG
jgi:hypothetical protein